MFHSMFQAKTENAQGSICFQLEPKSLLDITTPVATGNNFFFNAIVWNSPSCCRRRFYLYPFFPHAVCCWWKAMGVPAGVFKMVLITWRDVSHLSQRATLWDHESTPPIKPKDRRFRAAEPCEKVSIWSTCWRRPKANRLKLNHRETSNLWAWTSHKQRIILLPFQQSEKLSVLWFIPPQ